MEKDRKGPEAAEGASLLLKDVYCVCFPQRDSIEALQGELAAARRRFFTGGRKAVKVGRREIVKGFDGDLRGKLSRWGFYWKKTALGVSGQKAVALEEAFDQKGGYVLVCRDFRGVIVSRVFFSKEHAWQKSEYYEPWDPGTAKVMFKPDPMEDTIGRYDWDPAKKLYRSVILHPAPYQAGSAEQALVNARFGEPQLLVALEEGQLCYCPQKEAEARARALEEISSGTMVLMPAWEIKEGAFLSDEGEEDTAVTFTSLEEYARVEPKKKSEPAPAPPPPIPAQARELPEPRPIPEPAPPPMEDAPSQPNDLDIEFILADARQADDAEAPMPSQEDGAVEPASPPPPVWEEELSAVLEAQPPEPPQPAAAPAPVPPVPAVEDSAILPFVREAMEQAAPQREEAPPVVETPAYAPQGYPLPGGYGQEEYMEDHGPAYEAEGPENSPPAAPPRFEEPPKRAVPSGPVGHGMGMEDTAILNAARQAGGEEPPRRASRSSAPRLGEEDTSILSAARQAGGAEPSRRARHGGTSGPGLGKEDASILSAARQAGGARPPQRAKHGNPERPGMGAEDTSILNAARQAGGMPPARQANTQRHAQKGGPVVPRHSGPGQAAPPAGGTPPPPAPPQTAPQRPPRPAPLANPDPMRTGKLSGKGRTEQPGGLTAYEGDYKDGKRQGFGSHYYKSGDLSYAGFWRDDKKDGLGVSFREGDHALHVARWVQGRPGQQVALFDKEGGLRFGGRIVGGKKEGAGVSISSADGSVLVTKWVDGQDTGMASAFDPDGNLLYYGSWKNGKRHGHGTEFDINGGIVFDGEWRDDQYYNGILYQKPAEEPPYPDTDYAEPDWEM